MISWSLAAMSIGTVTILGLAGCSPLTPANSNQSRTTSTSSIHNPTVKEVNASSTVVDSIQPQPSGLLIELGNKANPAVKQIVHSPRFGASNMSLSFTLKNVQLENRSIAKLNESVGNQLIQNLKVQKHGTDITVSMTLMQPINKINLGTSGSYMGIALQYEPQKRKPTPHQVARIPSWFFNDILTAASVQGTPVKAETYGRMLPFHFSDKTYMLKAPLNGSQETVGFSGYFGSLSLYESYFNMLNAKSNGTENLYSLVNYGLIRERKNDQWYGVKAIMVNMQNGWQLGFAKNQLIVENNHAGALTYTVYPVQGIKLGTPVEQ